MYRNLRILCICFFFCHAAYAATTKQNSETELQVLIDVSGSMKQTDPHNLRIPAVKLLLSLLPDGTKAGIWLFDQKSTELVKTGVVNAKWKKKAFAKLHKIHSKGLYTNVEEAIDKASEYWLNSTMQKNTNKHKRHMILLTDGMVDISKDIMQSAESRDRVMYNQVKQLQQAGVEVHTIALSDNADAELMDKLAFDTNGWSETVQSAEQLQKVFFKMFKKAVPQDSLPIIGNTFTVDASIKEFSVLIFKKAGSSAPQLLGPDKSKIIRVNSNDNVAWLHEKNYDLVTVKKPVIGEWKIIAEMDPDNQVMIVTDLKFNVDEIPNHISKNESLDIFAYFTDQHQVISRDDFLSLIDISVEVTDPKGRVNQWKMQPVKGKDGLFNKQINKKVAKGINTIKIIADGKTFQREYTKSIEIIESPVLLETETDMSLRTVKLKFFPVKTILDTEHMSIVATITQAGMDSETRTVEKKNGKWELIIDSPVDSAAKIINFSIMAKSLKGKSISPFVKPVVVDDNLFPEKSLKPEMIEKPVQEIEQELSIANNNKQQTKQKQRLEPVEEGSEDEEQEIELEQQTQVDWIITSAKVIIINVVLLTIGFFAFKYMRKKAAEKQAQLLSRLE